MSVWLKNNTLQHLLLTACRNSGSQSSSLRQDRRGRAQADSPFEIAALFLLILPEHTTTGELY